MNKIGDDRKQQLKASLRKALAEIAHLAKDAQGEWEAAEQFTPVAEYQRGYMNAMHQALKIIEKETHVLEA